MEVADVPSISLRCSMSDQVLSHIPAGITISNIVDSVRRLCNPSGIALHGSRFRGDHDVFSDIDILVTTLDPGITTSYRMLGGCGLDIFAGTIDEFHRLLEAQPLTRAFRVLLNAGIASKSLYDPQGIIRDLQTRAVHIWEQGPRPLSKTEIEETNARLHQGLRSAERLIIRGLSDPTNYLPAMIRCDYVIVELIYHHFRINRKWTTDFPKLLKQLHNERSSLGELCDSYASAGTSIEKLRVASQIYSLVSRQRYTPVQA